MLGWRLGWRISRRTGMRMRRVGARPRGRGHYWKVERYLIKEGLHIISSSASSPISAHPTHLVLSPSSSTVTPSVSASSASPVLAAVVALVVVPERKDRISALAPTLARKRKKRTTLYQALSVSYRFPSTSVLILRTRR
jgi:hypothetical protein